MREPCTFGLPFPSHAYAIANLSVSSPTPVTWRALILSAVALFFCLSLGCGALGYWAWTHLMAQVQLQDQVAQVALPAELPVHATVTNKVQVKIDQVLPVHVPIHQTLSIPIVDPIPVTADLDTTVPIDLQIPVDQSVRIDQEVDINTQVKTRLLGFPLTLPVEGKVPLKMDVPLKLIIPVHQQLPLKISLPASVRLTEPLQMRLDTVLNTQVPLRESLALPVTRPVDATLTFPQRHIDAGLRALTLQLPLSAIRLAPIAASTNPRTPP